MTGKMATSCYNARLYTQKKEDQTDFCIWVAEQGLTALWREDNTVGITDKKHRKVFNPKAGEIVVILESGFVDILSEDDFKAKYVD